MIENFSVNTISGRLFSGLNLEAGSVRGFADYLQGILAEQLDWFGMVPIEVVYGACMVGFCLMVLGFVANVAGLSTYLERKVAADIQNRIGPSEIYIPIPFTDLKFRPWGLLQFIADGMKLIQKEDIAPRDADRLLFNLAPYIVFAGSFAVWAAIPFGPGVYAADFNLGLLYIVAVSGFSVIGILMGGWASGNKYSFYGAMRSAAQIVSYELPAGIVLLTIAVAYGTLNVNTIVQYQQELGLGIFGWGVFWYFPCGFIMFIVFFIAGVAEVNRTPFDLPESESELVSGFHTEYTGMRFGFWFMAEYANMFMVGALISVIFLGGWEPPYAYFGYAASLIPVSGSLHEILIRFESFIWFFLKGYFFVLVMMWMRWSLPRYRVDQLMHLAWKGLIPVAFVNLLAVGIYRWALGG